MGTVTIGRAYFDALLRSNVIISKEEHDHMQQCSRDYALLKSALFRGGLSMDTLNTLLAGESEANADDTSHYDYSPEKTFIKLAPVPDTLKAPHGHYKRTTHKDIAGVVRGGRLLDIFLRNDRSATVSFVEGAANFLSYIKRNDIYLHAKRLEFRWADRQFHVPPHISNKIVGGATRNLIVRGVASRVTEEQIRDHLNHIHNLVVVEVYFHNGDAYISTNSIHNALFARTCMMSRMVYKGTRIDWAPDECAAALPQPIMRSRSPVMRIPSVPFSTTNAYALLDTGSEIDSDGPNESFVSNGIPLDRNNGASAVVA
ncbi:hypothetical protein N0V86_002433 [Didymella sp. IMI 355093]|nr:hypothetical protein N0V86_002433 [Didymella sp. IMI 355093]